MNVRYPLKPAEAKSDRLGGGKRPIADISVRPHDVMMKDESRLQLAPVRRDLKLVLAQLAVDDPRHSWAEERRKGLISGIDEVFHFLFDDHDFDGNAVGLFFFDASEAAFVEAVKRALEIILDDIGDQGDDDFVQHPLWCDVTSAARASVTKLNDRNEHEDFHAGLS